MPGGPVLLGRRTENHTARRLVDREIEIAPWRELLEPLGREEIMHVRILLAATCARERSNRSADGVAIDVDDEAVAESRDAVS